MQAILARRLRRCREQSELTMPQLAELAQVQSNILYDLEKGKRPGVSAQVMRRIARALGTSVDYLIGTFDEDETSEQARAPSALSASISWTGRADEGAASLCEEDL